MIIVHSDGVGMTNFDHVERLVVNGVYLTAYMADGSNHPIGKYKSVKRASEVFMDFCKRYETYRFSTFYLEED